VTISRLGDLEFIPLHQQRQVLLHFQRSCACVVTFRFVLIYYLKSGGVISGLIVASCRVARQLGVLSVTTTPVALGNHRLGQRALVRGLANLFQAVASEGKQLAVLPLIGSTSVVYEYLDLTPIKLLKKYTL